MSEVCDKEPLEVPEVHAPDDDLRRPVGQSENLSILPDGFFAQLLRKPTAEEARRFMNSASPPMGGAHACRPIRPPGG